MENEDECRLIPLDEIVDPWVLLRPVNVNSIEYLQIRDTIRDKRLLNSIAVRPSTRWPGKYEVVDGMYRLTAFRELGKKAIPATVGDETDIEVLAAQIQANALRRETTPVEYAKQMRRIQQLMPDITMSEMAVMVGQSATWVGTTLSLLNLSKEIQKCVERDELPLLNAYMLAKMPQRIQPQYIDHAMQMPTAEFTALAQSVVRAVMEAARNGKLEAAFVGSEFKPVAYLLPVKKVEHEIATHEAGAAYILKHNPTPMQAWEAALRWVARIDDESIEKQRKAAVKRHKSNRIERDSYQALIESDNHDSD